MLAVTEMGQKSRKRIRSHYCDSHLHCGNHFSVRFDRRSFRAWRRIDGAAHDVRGHAWRVAMAMQACSRQTRKPAARMAVSPRCRQGFGACVAAAQHATFARASFDGGKKARLSAPNPVPWQESL